MTLLNLLYALLLSFAMVCSGGACGGSGDYPSPVTEPTPAPTPAPEPEPSSQTKDDVYKYSNNNWYEFYKSSKSDWSSGKVTFSLTDMAYADLGPGLDNFIFMAKMVTPNGKEGNFQYNIADLTPRLISQRFDGTCSRFCEHQSHGGVNWNAEETYSFTFTWNTSAVSLEVRDSSGNVVHSGFVPTDGAYAGVEWIRVGNGVLPPYPGVDGEITIINPTLE